MSVRLYTKWNIRKLHFCNSVSVPSKSNSKKFDIFSLVRVGRGSPHDLQQHSIINYTTYNIVLKGLKR